MNKQIKELDFIGEQGNLTKEKENALAKYFAEKRSKPSRKMGIQQVSKKRKTPHTTGKSNLQAKLKNEILQESS